MMMKMMKRPSFCIDDSFIVWTNCQYLINTSHFTRLGWSRSVCVCVCARVCVDGIKLV